MSAFKRHFSECQDTFLVGVYENLCDDKWAFEHNWQTTSTDLTECRRFNLMIKNLSKISNPKEYTITF
ncbi:hypothetical protein TTHERM_00090420 (macronuclear) [Tetrahymena thermophila SB210]|uniref:Uncharacterized protein n=1 Tax=Tetrahymena thermophila (strain SB210) TaxID=312017 RepID=Q236F2_TETTS|nr:hypothetical protein TTHERM_00090420 [Tetrahymena thermophila SB210]EAR92548.2 hypothetical protein TTHERM_00090420 [Tetrahymena thermophila SB210]|eukprot:XP_001012793.2 hypothetical protein TTHERM_00090420 [Tetrahymena thermophila SB210]